jgi:hypothetical protein
MNTPAATLRKICPYITAGSVNVSVITGPNGEPPGAKMTPCQCLGSECHLWVHDANQPSETGDCAHNVNALLMSMLLQTLMNLQAISLATAQKAGVEIGTQNQGEQKSPN